jgi:hypothetical protein
MKTLIKKLKGFFSKKPNVWYEDTIYHTGYYRFSEYFHGGIGGTFKVGGFPCLQQKGMKGFIFYSETDICGMRGVIPVEKCYHEKFNTNEK